MKRFAYGLFLALSLCHSASAQTLIVSLRPAVQVASRTVTVGDVVDFTGGSPQLRATIAALDLAEMSGSDAAVTVSRKQLQFRLRLADLPESLVQVEGEPSAHVTLRVKTIDPTTLVAAAKAALMEKLPWSPGQVLVELSQPVTVKLPQLAAGETVSIKAELHPGSRPPGRVQMDVTIFVQGAYRLALPVYLDVKVCQKVAVCLQRIEAGMPLTDANIYIDQRPLDGRSSQTLPCPVAPGTRVRRTMLPGQVVLTSDIEAAARPDNQVIVRTQQAVHMVMRLGGLKATASGVALQNGCKDQLIQVQNVDSKKVVMGRVVGPSTIEVE